MPTSQSRSRSTASSRWWTRCSLGASARALASPPDQALHAGQPALVVGALQRHILGERLVREDQKALLADSCDHALSHLLGPEQPALKQGGGAERILEGLLEHRRADAQWAQARDLDAGAGVGDRQPFGY